MDAFTVALADGLRDPKMSRRRMRAIAAVYAGFQAVMPLAGRGLTRFAASRFAALRRWIPWTGAALLFAIGARMIREGRRGASATSGAASPSAQDGRATLFAQGGVFTLFAQGFATSVDALSAGFALASYGLPQALASAAIISAVTFCDCAAGIAIGQRFGLRFSGRASVTGGVVLWLIAAEMILDALR